MLSFTRSTNLLPAKAEVHLELSLHREKDYAVHTYKYVDHRDAELREYPEVCDQRKCDSHRHRNEAGGKRISKKTAPDNNAQ